MYAMLTNFLLVKGLRPVADYFTPSLIWYKNVSIGKLKMYGEFILTLLATRFGSLIIAYVSYK